MIEQPVMVDPHNADKREAEHKSYVGGPLFEELRGKVVLSGRDPDFQDQQSDGNREYAVGEGFDSGRFFFHSAENRGKGSESESLALPSTRLLLSDGLCCRL